MAYRERHKTMRAAQHPEPPSATETSAAEKAEIVTEVRTRNKRERRNERATRLDGQARGKAEPRKARIAFADQLRKQQPEGAAGYRLVLPARSPAETPKIVPGPDSQGGIRYWRLEPFEIPDDIRLQDGLSYRVVWVSATGQPLSATTPYVPSLYFFLGPPDSEQDERNAAYEAIFRDVHDPALRQRIEAEVARSRLALKREEIVEQRTERASRMFEMEAREREDFQRSQRPDRFEQQQQEMKQTAEREKAAVAQEAPEERKLWTASKAMGGIAPTAANGREPFMNMKWLESARDDEAAKPTIQDGQKLAVQASRSVDAPISDQPNSQPSDARTMTVERSQSSPSLTPETESHAAPSQPAAPQAAEKKQPIGPAQATKIAQQSEATDDVVAYIRSLSTETAMELCGVALHIDLRFHLFALFKRQNPAWNSLTLPNPCDEFVNKEDMDRIKRIASNSHHVSAVIQLANLFEKAKAGGPAAMFALPAPLPSLTEQDHQAIKQCLATNEQMQYLAYLICRRSARAYGQPMPPPLPLRLSAAEQKAIRQFIMRDERAMFYVIKTVSNESPSRQS